MLSTMSREEEDQAYMKKEKRKKKAIKDRKRYEKQHLQNSKISVENHKKLPL